jgi:hypothetical protein
MRYVSCASTRPTQSLQVGLFGVQVRGAASALRVAAAMPGDVKAVRLAWRATL